MTSLGWERFADHYTDRGHRVLAPDWPGLPTDPAAVRRDPSPLAGLGIADVLEHYERIVRELDEPPLLVGHSLGGLVVQLLLDRGLGAAGVAIDSAAPRGVLRTPLSTLRSVGGILARPANRHRAVPLTFGQFRYAFANTLPEAEARAAYDRYAVPGAGRIVFQSATANLAPASPARVDFANPRRSPLLFVAGGADHIVPAAVNRENARRYRRSPAHTEYVEFPGRPHLLIASPGWQEIADHVLDWAGRVLDGRR
jgi:pimeloyl-ACP methyl ester carboxylesterase